MTVTDAPPGEVAPASVPTVVPADGEGGAAEEVPPLRPPTPLAVLVLRGALAMLALLLLAMVANLMVFSRLEHRLAQIHRYDAFRNELANGVGPVGGTQSSGALLTAATPIAYLQIPRLHVSEVVGEGTTSADLQLGPGHQRNTAFPGEKGVSVIMGRQAAFGGPFGAIGSLRKGDKVLVTTQVGATTYRVKDVRHPGSTYQAVPSGTARLILESASGTPFAPSSVVYVDADTTSAAPASPVPSITLSSSEKAFGVDAGGLTSLSFSLELLIVVMLGGLWSWHRWGMVRTWIVVAPAVVLAAYLVSMQATRLLPNLL